MVSSPEQPSQFASPFKATQGIAVCEDFAGGLMPSKSLLNGTGLRAGLCSRLPCLGHTADNKSCYAGEIKQEAPVQKYVIPHKRHSAAFSDSFAVLDEHLSSPAATRPPAARLRLALHDRTNIPTNSYLPPAVRKESAQPGGPHVLHDCARLGMVHGTGSFGTAPHSSPWPRKEVATCRCGAVAPLTPQLNKPGLCLESRNIHGHASTLRSFCPALALQDAIGPTQLSFQSRLVQGMALLTPQLTKPCFCF